MPVTLKLLRMSYLASSLILHWPRDWAKGWLHRDCWTGSHKRAVYTRHRSVHRHQHQRTKATRAHPPHSTNRKWYEEHWKINHSCKNVKSNAIFIAEVHLASTTSFQTLYWDNPKETKLLRLGNLRSYDGNCNENVTLKLNFALSLLRLFHVDHVVQNTGIALSLAWCETFSCKGKEWEIYYCDLPLSSEPQIWKFHVVVWQTTTKPCTKKRAARAARLFFFIQPIKSLICGVFVDVAFVKS